MVDTEGLQERPAETFTLPVVAINVDGLATGTLVTTATINLPSGITDTDLTNNSATDTDTLTPQADLRVT